MSSFDLKGVTFAKAHGRPLDGAEILPGFVSGFDRHTHDKRLSPEVGNDYDAELNL